MEKKSMTKQKKPGGTAALLSLALLVLSAGILFYLAFRHDAAPGATSAPESAQVSQAVPEKPAFRLIDGMLQQFDGVCWQTRGSAEELLAADPFAAADPVILSADSELPAERSEGKVILPSSRGSGGGGGSSGGGGGGSSGGDMVDTGAEESGDYL